MIGCAPIAIFTHEILSVVGIDSQIALADVDGKESYGHVYVTIDGKPQEPRYVGLYLQDNINYYEPYGIYESTDEYINAGHTIFPSINTIINGIGEFINL